MDTTVATISVRPQTPAIVEAVSNIKEFLGASMSDNTRRTYADLWQRFTA